MGLRKEHMNTFTKSLKTIGIAATFAGASMVASLPAVAQTTLSDILNRVQQDSQEQSAENTQRLRDFQTRVNEQENLMGQASAELSRANARGATSVRSATSATSRPSPATDWSAKISTNWSRRVGNSSTARLMKKSTRTGPTRMA